MRRSQQFLAAVGILIFALGASAALLASQLSVPHPRLPAAMPTAQESLNCHSDEFRRTVRAMRPISIVNAEPDTSRVIPIGMPANDLAVIPIAGDTRPYVVTAANPEVMGEPELKYLLRTDRGEALLARNWHTMYELLRADSPAATPICEACHLATPAGSAISPASGL